MPYPNCVRTVSSMFRYLCLSSSTRARCLWAGSSFLLNTSASLAMISCSACLNWVRTLSWFWVCKRHNQQIKSQYHKQHRIGIVQVTPFVRIKWLAFLIADTYYYTWSCLICCNWRRSSETFFLKCRRFMCREMVLIGGIGTELLSGVTLVILDPSTGEEPPDPIQLK